MESSQLYDHTWTTADGLLEERGPYEVKLVHENEQAWRLVAAADRGRTGDVRLRLVGGGVERLKARERVHIREPEPPAAGWS